MRNEHKKKLFSLTFKYLLAALLVYQITAEKALTIQVSWICNLHCEYRITDWNSFGWNVPLKVTYSNPPVMSRDIEKSQRQMI